MNYSNIYPTLDLHGEYQFSAKYLTEEFLNDNILLKNYKLYIVHGLGDGLVKKAVYEVLKRDKRVKEFKQDIFNPGCTIVELWEEKWTN